MDQILKIKLGREVKDYLSITFGLICYALGWAAFLLPYQITTGGVTGISAIIYYVTGIEIQVSYFIINAVFLGFALKILGPKFSLKTIYAIFMLTFLLWLFQALLKNPDGTLPQLLGPGQEFMACVVGAGLLGFGIGIVFCNNGSTGGTDIIAWIINKYKDVTLGRMMMYCDIVIISSCYFIFHDWKRVLFGFCVLFIMSIVIDYVINSSRQSVQFLIFSRKHDEIAEGITKQIDRGVTLLDGTGWYSKQGIKVVVVLAKKSQSLDIFRLVKDIDPNAFISKSNVKGYSEGWVKTIKNSIAQVAPHYTMKRQLDDYYAKFYTKEAKRFKELVANDYAKAKELAAWKERVAELWDSIEIVSCEKTEDLGDLVDIDLREDDLLGDAEGVVALTVELLVDTLEVADTRQSHGNQALQELVHLACTQRHTNADGHALTQFEVRDILSRLGLHGLLTCDERKLLLSHVDKFLIGDGLAHTLVNNDLLEFRTLHDARVAELLHKGRYDLLLILCLECRYVCCHYLISSPDFLAKRTNLPAAFCLRPIRVGLPLFGSRTCRFEMWIADSCSMIPP